MKCFRVKGSNFECGVQLGQQFRFEMQRRLDNYQINSATVAPHLKQLQQIYQYCNRKYNSNIQELKGISKGSGIDFWHLFYLNCSEISQNVHGCSSIAVVDQKNVLLAHNEDGDREERKEGCALIHYVLPTFSFHSYVYLGELAGSAYNWNENGLFFTLNYIPVKRLNLLGLPYYFLTRSLLEAKSIGQAIQFLKKNPCMSGFHCFIGQGNRIVSVEKYHDAVSVQEIKGFSPHTNHFVHGLFTSKIVPSSKVRLQRLQELLSIFRSTPHFISTADVVSLLFDTKSKDYPIYANGNTRITLSTVLFDAMEKKVLIFPKDSKTLNDHFKLH